jgi:hypothetical protein
MEAVQNRGQTIIIVNTEKELTDCSEKRYINRGGGRDKFSAMKVPRQCPLVFLVKKG